MDQFETQGATAAFVEALGGEVQRGGRAVHACVVMHNHYHLVVQTVESNPVEGMRWSPGLFANRIDRLRGEIGHVFRGRYKALLVEPWVSLVGVFDDVLLNPVRPGLIKDSRIMDYRFNSLPEHLPHRRPRWLQRRHFLELLRLPENARRIRAYLQRQLAWTDRADPAPEPVKEHAAGVGSSGPTTTAKPLPGSSPGSSSPVTEAVRLHLETSAINPWIARRLNTRHPWCVSKRLKETPRFLGRRLWIRPRWLTADVMRNLLGAAVPR